MQPYFKEKITLPIEVGSEIRYGKFLNKLGIVKGFSKDKNNQPLIQLEGGKEIPLLKLRIASLLPVKESYKRLFKEEKQVGVLYHFTNSVYNILGILKEGFKADKDTIEFLQNATKTFNLNYDPYDNDLNSYSFTRDSNLDFFGKIRISLDGTKLSNTFKIIQFSKSGKNYRKWSEERIISKKNPLNLNELIEIEKMCKENNIKLEMF